MAKKYKHRKIVNEIAEKTDLDPRLIHLIIRKFYDGMRKLMKRNEEINIQGFFVIKLSTHYKKQVNKKGKNINLRKRKDQKPKHKNKTNKQ